MSQLRTVLGILTVGIFSLISSQALAQETPALNSGNTAWLLTSTALVLFMTLPGLALFYGGLVHSKNVLSALMHCLTICCVVSVLWLLFVYSLVFGDGGSVNQWIGGFGKSFLSGVGVDTLSGDVPETVFFMFQMTFAIITPALIVGAYAERIKFGAVILFTTLWLILVYAPIAHWVWGGGWLADLGVMDFAGGLVVHLACGVGAIAAAAVLGRRKGFPTDVTPPHSPGMTMAGACMLWVGWYGFNAGSALAANGNAGMAMTVTHIAAATAALTWMFLDWAIRGKPTLVGTATGVIAGLATITPASGFVGPLGGLVIGLAAGLVCYFGVGFVKGIMKIDDALDVLAVHGFGGATGVALTAVFAATGLGGLGLSVTIGEQLGIQLVGVAAVVIWTAVLTFIIVKVVSALVGFRVNEEEEAEGLDTMTHGERGYRF